ncbi:MAG: hypothetical protein JW914_00320 [Syntrophaceae bacterium]|nr:hypothetical protein [Syntrophaceae bacterium]
MGWVEEPSWPVSVSIIDKNHRNIASLTITSDMPFTICAYLRPGEYYIFSSLPYKDQPSTYWDAYGPRIQISKDQEPLFSGYPTIKHKKKIIPLYPIKYEEVSVKRPTLKWEPFAGAYFYSVGWFEKDGLNGRVIKTKQKLKTKIPQYTFDEDLIPNRTYEWFVSAYDKFNQNIAYYSSCYFKTSSILSDK